MENTKYHERERAFQTYNITERQDLKQDKLKKMKIEFCKSYVIYTEKKGAGPNPKRFRA